MRRRQARRTLAELDREIVAAEDTAYAHHGVAREERYLDLDTGLGGVEVRVSVFGTQNHQPPVLLLHGIGSAQVLAAPLLPFLSDRQVIALDWPGHGLSQSCVLTPGHDMRAHASMVIASLLDALDVTACDLVGHSMGAQFGLYAALDLPERLRRLVLLGAPGAAFEGIRPLVAMKLLAVPRLGPALLSRPMSERAFDRFQDQALGAGALAATPELVPALRLLTARTANAAALASYFRAMIRHGAVRAGVALSAADLGHLIQPTLLVWGDHDVFLSPGTAARSIVALPDAHLVRVPGAGHAPWLQATQRVGNAVAQHLNTVTSG